MTDENYQGVGDNGVGGSLGTGDSWTAAMLTEIEKRIDDELEKFKAAIQGNGVISGLAVSQKGAGADQSVDVASGSCVIAGTKYTEGSTVNVALDAAHGTYARWDIITYDASAGDPSKVTGTAGAIPTIPDVPSGDIILALVLRAANDNVVSDAEITDKRITPAMSFAMFDSDKDGKIDWDALDIAVTAGDTLVNSVDSDVEFSDNDPTLVPGKKFKCWTKGTWRVKFGLKCNTSGQEVAGRIYKNGVAHGTDRTRTSTAWATFSEDLAFVSGDTIELWAERNGTSGGHVKEFRVYIAEDFGIALPV